MESHHKLPFANFKAQKKEKDALIAAQEEHIAYIEFLEALLADKNIEIPKTRPGTIEAIKERRGMSSIKDTSRQEIVGLLKKFKVLHKNFHVTIDFKDLNIWTMAGKKSIPTVGNQIKHMILGSGPKHRVDILKGLTGRIKPYSLTLVLGPPGAGRSVFMKTLSGRVSLDGATLEGKILFNGDDINSGKFLVRKVVDYIEEQDTHAATLTVEETLKYAWTSTTGGHHRYGFGVPNEEAARKLDIEDKKFSRVHNTLIGLGLFECRKTYVGDATIRGISGGQKRRVTTGEILVLPRSVKFMDNISNGLDSATTFDIVRALSIFCHHLGQTYVISLLQPSPEIYNLFDEIILLSEGQIIFQGPRDQILPYFENLGYKCPDYVDDADFLQELPTVEGLRYLISEKLSTAPKGTDQLVKSWKESQLFKDMEKDMTENIAAVDPYTQIEIDEESEEAALIPVPYPQDNTPLVKEWPLITRIKYAGTFYFHFNLTLMRQISLTIRDLTFIKSRVGQSMLVGAIAGSLFNNIKTEDVSTMNGFLFFSMLFGALANFSLMPLVFAQKAVFKKHSEAYFYPTTAFTLAQAIVLYPLQLTENIIFSLIVYWSAGLSQDHNGSRFLTFILLTFVFSNTIAQLFRLISFCSPSLDAATPISGVLLILMVLFSGFIQPKSVISDGWIWFYWMNPIAWALKSVTVNEFKAPKYDFLTCTNQACTETMRFGDFVLEQYGNPTDENYIWYSLAVMVGMYLLFFILSNFALEHLHFGNKSLRIIAKEEFPDEEEIISANDPSTQGNTPELPFDIVNFAFKDISYSVPLPNGEEIELLKNVSGYFEPGTVTALMGSSGAGKTTLLDVLSGRKNTGTITGGMFVNGQPKEDKSFRRIMAYVEQFDSLSQKATARENIEFSAALRLSSKVTSEQRKQWVNSILDMMGLTSIERNLVGSMSEGGMSFEQRKRLSVAVELAANPSILFLDEPTTGLDSRAAQVFIRNIRKIAEGGRAIVCTIHQPSTPIFYQFDSLLLLKRGGQTVFFGKLGEKCESLIKYFEGINGVQPIHVKQNPANWMLEAIGAGTTQNGSSVDFNDYYKKSHLCYHNNQHLSTLIPPDNDEEADEETGLSPDQVQIQPQPVTQNVDDSLYPTSYWNQFVHLTRRTFLDYWRTPSYNFVRIFVNIIVALIFGSAYPNQNYTDNIGTVSRSAVIYITTMFCGVIGLMTVVPVTFESRAVFYREQQSNMYSINLFALLLSLVEIPYILISSLAFVLPFFYIVGFDSPGNGTQKFFWYWLFHALYLTVLTYLGQFFCMLLPTNQVTQVATGLMSTIISLFCGFLITQKNFPDFWLFMYWLNPLHYALEGLNMSQFHNDDTMIKLSNGAEETAESFINQFYDGWSYHHIGLDVLALFIFIILIRIGTLLSLTYLRHNKR